MPSTVVTTSATTNATPREGRAIRDIEVTYERGTTAVGYEVQAHEPTPRERR